MAPFIERPEGFSSEALELLDNALTRLWLEQVAIGAALSARPTGSAPSPSSETLMPPHRYKAGQDVYFNPPKGAVQVASQKYKILRLLPLEGGEFSYRIKSATEHFERVAKESELSRSP